MEVKKKSCLLINEAGFEAYCLTYRILQFCLQLPRSLHISPVIQVFPSHDQNIYSIPWSVNSSLLSTSEPTIVTWLQKELGKFVSCGMLHHKRGSPPSLKMLHLLEDIFRGLLKQCAYPWAILYFSCKNLEYAYYILKIDFQQPNWFQFLP